MSATTIANRPAPLGDGLRKSASVARKSQGIQMATAVTGYKSHTIKKPQ